MIQNNGDSKQQNYQKLHQEINLSRHWNMIQEQWNAGRNSPFMIVRRGV